MWFRLPIMPLTSDLCAYNPQWPALFEGERIQIQNKLGDCILAIHHIGSTAIPEMIAKPEIDILVIARQMMDMETVHTGMTKLGYDVRGECGIERRYYYSKHTAGVRTHKAHVCERSHPNVRQQMAFRNYMLDHVEEAQAYGALKVKLAETNTNGMTEYLDGKQDYIAGIIEKALDKGYGHCLISR
jgi:GrpB-like predicted nucleotidyltransferase (UPF0157 family)